MIRAVVHLIGDQPIVVELDALPAPSDVVLVCRNVRTVDGKRPVYIDHSNSTFAFPFAQIRFIEVATGAESAPSAEAAEPDELEIDEDFLRRVREA